MRCFARRRSGLAPVSEVERPRKLASQRPIWGEGQTPRSRRRGVESGQTGLDGSGSARGVTVDPRRELSLPGRQFDEDEPVTSLPFRRVRVLEPPTRNFAQASEFREDLREPLLHGKPAGGEHLRRGPVGGTQAPRATARPSVWPKALGTAPVRPFSRRQPGSVNRKCPVGTYTLIRVIESCDPRLSSLLSDPPRPQLL